MDRLEFIPAQGEAPERFYILAQTMAGGRTYLLVTNEDPESDAEGEAFILRDDSAPEDAEALYTFVEEDGERESVAEIFRQLLDEEEIDLEDEAI